MSNYTQDITQLPLVESLPSSGHMYGDNGSNAVVRILVEDFINSIGGTPPLVVSGGGAVPGPNVHGKVGQLAINTDLGRIDICRKIVTVNNVTTYTWEQIPTYTFITENYRKVTLWDYATSNSKSFVVPTTQSGTIGDRIIMTTGTGTGGEIWELVRIITNLGTTSYYWDRVVHGEDLKMIKEGSLVSIMSITLTAAGWSNSAQTISLSGYTVTSRTKVDIETDATVFNQLLADNCKGIYIVNNNGTLTAHALGEVPSENLTIQISVREVTPL